MTRFLIRIFLCWAFAGVAHAENCSLHATYDSYPPFSYRDDDGRPKGFDVEVLEMVLAHMHCRAQIVERPWDDVLVQIKAGREDIAVGVGYHAQRAAWAWFSEPFREERVALLIRKGESAKFPGADFGAVMRAGLRFGRTDGDSDTPPVAAGLAAHPAQVRSGVIEEDNFKRLLAGEIDGFLIERRFGATLASQLGVSPRIEFHPAVLTPGRYRFMFSKASVSADFVARFDAQLQLLLAEDAFGALAVKYGVE